MTSCYRAVIHQSIVALRCALFTLLLKLLSYTLLPGQAAIHRLYQTTSASHSTSLVLSSFVTAYVYEYA